MNAITQVITGFFIVLAIGFISSFARKQGKKAEMNMSLESFTLHTPKIYVWVGGICSALFLAMIVLMTIFPNDTADWWVYLVFLAFVLLGLFIIYYYFKWKIEIQDNQIVYTPVFGKKRTYLFSDITKVKKNSNQYNDILKIYVNDKKAFSLESVVSGYNLFVERLNRQKVQIEEKHK